MKTLLVVLLAATAAGCGHHRQEPSTPAPGSPGDQIQASDALTATPVQTVPASTIRRARTAASTANDRIASTESAVDSILGQGH